ncbi:nucleoside triphosphate pyrophosphatase [Phorcysia thermohydrogeniphila]|uniref:dTTP/UTP pyrophosphatase n=1 Tax=Phorcysia thermohydrogeniphila TaxID=936138 RepID=A0A4R1GPN6_9BACT|nr:Maf family protein [Phorcysia thermohydrogeniphila]TCK06442.1 septum formation protein [Phorcysia thermohydrogeniphila]
MRLTDLNILLASSSPRRREILSMVGVNFRVVRAKAEEKLYSTPVETAVKNAEQKVLSVKNELKDGEVALSADTIVVLGDEILGKPESKEEAVEYLKRLSGRWHTVITGFALLFPNGKLISSFEESRVKFKRLSPEEIEWYVSTGEPLDKAGAYGIQGIGALLIERIDGDFFNVMGLPISRIYDILILES